MGWRIPATDGLRASQRRHQQRPRRVASADGLAILSRHVAHVITLGSPVVGGPKYTAMARFFRAAGGDLEAIEREIQDRERTPIRTPITAIYTESDGVVDWRACIDRVSHRVEHVAVRSTHCGLGFTPDVLRIIAERLALYR